MPDLTVNVKQKIDALLQILAIQRKRKKKKE